MTKEQDNQYRVKVFVFGDGQCFINNRQHYLNVGSDDWSQGDVISYGSVQNQKILSITTYAENIPTKSQGEQLRRQAIELCKKVGLKPINDERSLKAKQTQAELEEAQ